MAQEASVAAEQNHCQDWREMEEMLGLLTLFLCNMAWRKCVCMAGGGGMSGFFLVTNLVLS